MDSYQLVCKLYFFYHLLASVVNLLSNMAEALLETATHQQDQSLFE